MAYYRAYILDDEGHIASVQELDCGSDEQAVEQAKRLVIGHDVELWCENRLITRLTPE